LYRVFPGVPREICVRPVVYVDVFVLRSRKRSAGSVSEPLVIEESDDLRRAVFRDGEVIGGQAFHRLAAFVRDDHRLYHQLRGRGKRSGTAASALSILPNLLRR